MPSRSRKQATGWPQFDLLFGCETTPLSARRAIFSRTPRLRPLRRLPTARLQFVLGVLRSKAFQQQISRSSDVRAQTLQQRGASRQHGARQEAREH